LASASSSRALAAAALVALLCGLWAPQTHANVYASKDEALREAFPDAERIEEQSYVLTPDQAAAIAEQAKAPLERQIWTLYSAYRGNTLLGSAVIDVRNVRTLPEALLIVIAPDGSVRSLRVLAFHEPTEYQPSERWLAQMDGKRLGPDLHLKRAIHTIAGATLSSQAVTRSVRTALALYQVLLANDAAAE
jgi:Na+-translocating ferredoxin:NAD+ oxidoreductase RnfG subunit